MPQYIFLNRVPGVHYRQNDPGSIGDALFRDPINALGLPSAPAPTDARVGEGDGACLMGQSFIFSYFDGPINAIEGTLRRVLALAAKHRTPTLIVLDGQNWWGHQPDLWNWFDPSRPGYDSANRANVEWTADDPDAAVKICWRNWGRQIRVLPQPNLASPPVP